MLNLSMGAGVLNSDSHAYTTSSSPIEPSPRDLGFIAFKQQHPYLGGMTSIPTPWGVDILSGFGRL